MGRLSDSDSLASWRRRSECAEGFGRSGKGRDPGKKESEHKILLKTLDSIEARDKLILTTLDYRDAFAKQVQELEHTVAWD